MLFEHDERFSVSFLMISKQVLSSGHRVPASIRPNFSLPTPVHLTLLGA